MIPAGLELGTQSIQSRACQKPGGFCMLPDDDDICAPRIEMPNRIFPWGAELNGKTSGRGVVMLTEKT
jgi:hypothetical protein